MPNDTSHTTLLRLPSRERLYSAYNHVVFPSLMIAYYTFKHLKCTDRIFIAFMFLDRPLWQNRYHHVDTANRSAAGNTDVIRVLFICIIRRSEVVLFEKSMCDCGEALGAVVGGDYYVNESIIAAWFVCQQSGCMNRILWVYWAHSYTTTT